MTEILLTRPLLTRSSTVLLVGNKRNLTSYRLPLLAPRSFTGLMKQDWYTIPAGVPSYPQQPPR